LGRDEVRWSILNLVRLDEQVDRPLNLVEGILNRDKKVATYKPALIRALAEIAQTEYHIARHTLDGKVKIPTQAIAEKWLLYYWPIFENPTFIRQQNGEESDSRIQLAIRRPITELIAYHSEVGGMPSFYVAWKTGNLDEHAEKLLKKAISTLRRTIWDMPVRHAGEGEFTIFQYDRNDKTIVMSSNLWREFCLTGSWIQDATVLRWAELSERLSPGRIQASMVIDCLLSVYDPERNVREARKFYGEIEDLRCVWTMRQIARRFDVDHAIPFSLWRNNDLWNLLPSSPKVNNSKRDRLPNHDLLLARRDLIIDCWQSLRHGLGKRFVQEAQTLLGRIQFKESNWENVLFSRFVEAVETTACQRGVPRWQPDDFELPVRLVRRSVETSKNDEKERETGRVIISFSEIEERDRYIRFLPLVGGIAAGTPFHGMESSGLKDVLDCEWFEVPRELSGKNRYLVRVEGKSMEPTYNPGDLLVFEYHRNPRRMGDVVIANIAEFGVGETGVEMIKRIDQNGDNWIFRSDNPDYADIEIAKSELEYPILGILVGKL